MEFANRPVFAASCQSMLLAPFSDADSDSSEAFWTAFDDASSCSDRTSDSDTTPIFSSKEPQHGLLLGHYQVADHPLSTEHAAQSPRISFLDYRFNNSRLEEVRKDHCRQGENDFKKSTLHDNGFDCSKALRSPINFFSPCSTEELRSPSLDLIHRVAPISNEHKVPRYVFYPPGNPSDKSCPPLNCQRGAPRRQLHYGEGFPLSGPRPLKKTATVSEAGLAATWSSDEDECGVSSKEYLKASAFKPWYSQSHRANPRSWLDLEEDREEIQKAVSDQPRTGC